MGVWGILLPHSHTPTLPYLFPAVVTMNAIITILILAALMLTAIQPVLGGSMTYINEFPHPKVIVHWHPTTSQFTLDDLQHALGKHVHAAELDVHYRPSDGQVICNHDSATPVSPTLDEAIKLILRAKGQSPTVNHDGLQFFLVIEPKENLPVLFDGIANVLSRYVRYLSTAVVKGGPPRGITIVITGGYPREFYAHFPPEMINRLCIAETHDYAGEITNLSALQTCFQWVSLKYGRDIDRMKALQTGTDPRLQGRFNVRIWDGHANMDKCVEAGADSINADRDEIDTLYDLIARRDAGR